MVDRSNVGGGLGLVAAVAVESTGIILASYHLHRRLGADLDLKVGITEQRRQSWTPKKKKKEEEEEEVRFADELVTDPSMSLDPREECRRRRRAAAVGPIRAALRKA